MLRCTAIVSAYRYNVSMSDTAKTPIRTVRVDDELWTAVQAQAKLDGITVTSVIVDGLLRYLTNARIKNATTE